MKLTGKLFGFGIGLFLAIASLGSATVSALDTDRDCDRFAVIHCGTMNAAELRAEFESNNANSSNGSTTTQPDIKKVFAHFGINGESLRGSFKQGIVKKNGNVLVDGKVVATGAVMAARGLGGTPIAGTNASRVSVSAMSDAQTALVKFDANGKFLYAVMKPCGNPVTATPKTTPPTPPPAQPAVNIVKFVDHDKKYIRVGVNVEYTYRVVVSNPGEVDLTNVKVTDTPDKGVTLISVTPQIGTFTNNTWSYTLPSLPKGTELTFTFVAKVPAYLAGRIVNTVCVDAPQVPGNPDKCDKAEVDVPTPPGNIVVCVLADKTFKTIAENAFDSTLHSKNPDDCKTTPTELPKTGPMDTVMQVIGAMSLVSASAYYIASRRLA